MYVLGVIAFFVMVGFGVVVPVLPVYAKSFGVGYVEVGAVVAAFALMRLVASPYVGRMIDAFGGAHGAGHRHRHRGDLERARRHRPGLPPAAAVARAGGIGSAIFSVSA